MTKTGKYIHYTITVSLSSYCRGMKRVHNDADDNQRSAMLRNSSRQPAHTPVLTPAVAAAYLITTTSQGVCASVVRRAAWLHTESILLIIRLRQLQSASLMTLLVLKAVATVTQPRHICHWPYTRELYWITAILVGASALASSMFFPAGATRNQVLVVENFLILISNYQLVRFIT